MTLFEIEGGVPLRGQVKPAGNKNAVLPMLAAALLTDEPVVIENAPAIGDVRTMLDLAQVLGAEAEWDPALNRLQLCARGVRDGVLSRDLCSQIRAGILFVAPLLHRFGRAVMAPPGGDVIGRRRLDSHLEGLAALGVQAEVGDRLDFSVRPPGLAGNDCFLPEASVTATEHMLLAAVLARGTTVIRNAACEPHVQDLGQMLCAMGARIQGLGSNTITVEGVSALRGTHHRVSSDYTEVGSLLALAAATGGELLVEGVDPAHYRMISRVFRRLGIELSFSGDCVLLGPNQCRRVTPDLRGGIPVVDDGPWPQFPSDLMSVMILLATQVQGTVLFFEKMYESRMYFVDRLIAMGANAVICDPHRVVVSGPSALHAIELSSPDIRAGMALLGGALCARGTSVIRNVRLIDRGYEGIEEKLSRLGARIVRRSENGRA